MLNRKEEDTMATQETAKKKFTRDSLIGDVINSSPAAMKIIEKHFGNGCFSCPGVKMEAISFGAMMHNMDPEKIVQELNELEG
jgi:hybrid cluster-associated redox disulfide protein